jgi:hypothetical protein
MVASVHSGAAGCARTVTLRILSREAAFCQPLQEPVGDKGVLTRLLSA